MAIGAPPGVSIRVDPTLAEAAVGAVLRVPGADPAAVARHRVRWNVSYDLPEGSRAAAFERLAVAEFTELDLAGPIRQAIAERPALAVRVEAVLLGEARGRRDEGVTCEAGGVHLGIRVDSAALAEPARLLRWARHVMGHAEDTLDPAFGFVPGWDEAAAARVGAMPARLHALWDVSVDARIARLLGLPEEPFQADHIARIGAVFRGISDVAAAGIVDLMWETARPRFDTLHAWAAEPARLVSLVAPDAAGSVRPDRCPLCRFPGDDVRPPEAQVATLAMAMYPDWRPDQGLCSRCADRFRLAGLCGGER